jgi:hypothetical protein
MMSLPVDRLLQRFERDSIIFAHHPDRQEEFLQPLEASAIANRDVFTGPIGRIFYRLDLQETIDVDQTTLEVHALAVYVADHRAKRTHQGDRIGTHPDQMAGIHIQPDHGCRAIAELSMA